MTSRQMYDFAIGQIAWYEKMNGHIEHHLAFCNNQLARSRKQDKEVAEYALATQPDDPITVKIFSGNYISNETRKLINERAKYYRERKLNDKMIAHYKSEADYYERFIG